jgi:hypothetical protein
LRRNSFAGCRVASLRTPAIVGSLQFAIRVSASWALGVPMSASAKYGIRQMEKPTENVVKKTVFKHQHNYVLEFFQIFRSSSTGTVYPAFFINKRPACETVFQVP